jgi:uroporphyrinogen decarboxylase
MNTRFHNAIKGIPQNIPPVWFMRQAGRYHKHYQALRREHSFVDLCKKPDRAAETAMGPIRDFDFDVAILFSDLLFPLEALGMGLKYDPAPELSFQLTSSRIKDLKSPRAALEGLAFQKDALEATRKVLPKDKSLIGFVGGPWTLFTYAAEGGHKGNLIAAKTGLNLYHRFCESLLPLLEMNIKLQLEGGAEVVMLFDTAAGELSPTLFNANIVPHLRTLAETYPGKLGYYSKGTTAAHLVSLRTCTAFAGFGVDHRFELRDELLGQRRGFLQGNFDQALLFSAPEEFEVRLDEYLEPLLRLTRDQRRHWVSGLGHGVLPNTPEDNVRRFVKRIREAFA